MTDDFLDDRLEANIARESKSWDALGINNYQIEIRESGVWAEYDLKILVKDNRASILDANCGDALLDTDQEICKTILQGIDANSYTINGIFEQLKASRVQFRDEWGDEIASTWNESLAITFDPDYHYPRRIRYDVEDAADEESTTEITAFEIAQD